MSSRTAQRVGGSSGTPRGHKEEKASQGSAGSGLKIKPYAGQDFYALRDEHYKKGQLFEDKEFPANDRSIYYETHPGKKLEWKRPLELVKDPAFVVGEANRFDVAQGELGDCWLLASVASLSLHDELFKQVCPVDQDFKKDDKFKYAGIFHFRFWKHGDWIDVVVDDRLPTFQNQLLYLHSTTMNEFWSALLEKAYAKICGSYEALKGGSSSEGMEDFTGGITEVIELRGKAPKNLFDMMMKANQRSSLMGCSIEAQPGKIEAELPNGLIMGHAYSVTDVKFCQTSASKEKTPLVRVRNPWGNEAEWKGAWSDKSQEWKSVSDGERKKLGLSFDSDGEFWMSFNDFVSNYDRLEICHLGPDSLNADSLSGKKKTRWEEIVINGEWVRRVTAGGCRNFIDTFWTNPQFRVKIIDPDEDDEENMGTIIVGLMQKDRRKKRKEGAVLETIGYVIYKLKGGEPEGPQEVTFFKKNASVAKSYTFVNLREIAGRHKLAPGDYFIVPSTFEPQKEADFLLRIYSEKPQMASESDVKTSVGEGASKDLTAAAAKSPFDEKAAKANFDKVAGDDQEVDAQELADLLNSTFRKDFPFDGFSLEAARSMVALNDADQTGKLGLDEFLKLSKDMNLYKEAFKKHDSDKSGKFNSYELRDALKSLGLNVSNKVFHSLVMRYANKKGEIGFDDFVVCVCRLKTVIDNYKAQSKDQRGNATFELDEFVQVMMYT